MQRSNHLIDISILFVSTLKGNEACVSNKRVNDLNLKKISNPKRKLEETIDRTHMI